MRKVARIQVGRKVIGSDWGVAQIPKECKSPAVSRLEERAILRKTAITASAIHHVRHVSSPKRKEAKRSIFYLSPR